MRLRFFSARRKNRGELILRPSDEHREVVEPEVDAGDRHGRGSAAGSVSITKLAKYRPAESLITVTLDGSNGSGRDQRTSTSPILGRRSFPAGSTLNRALAVNRMACRRSLRDRNRGGLIVGPFPLALERGEEVPVRGVQVRKGLLGAPPRTRR